MENPLKISANIFKKKKKIPITACLGEDEKKNQI